MSSGTVLYKSGAGWQPASEAALEKLVWENLPELLGLTPLKQQHISQGERSDILAVDDEGGLVVLELKNTEDRYLIQQLTRYYENLLTEKPFQEKVDYTRPVRLIAIAPTFHRHNLTDQKHSSLKFELLQFSIVQEGEGFQLVLRDLELETVYKCGIPYQSAEIPVVEGIDEPPALLLGWLGSCSPSEQVAFLKVRNKILSCSSRMKEIVDKKTIQYGSGKTKLCAEICFQQKAQKPVLFLWLPTPGTYNAPGQQLGTLNETDYVKKEIIGRLRIWTDGQNISHVGHVPEGFGMMKLQSEWDQLPPSKRRRGLVQSLSSRSDIPPTMEWYLRFPKNEKPPDYWEFLSELAIEKWLAKI